MPRLCLPVPLLIFALLLSCVAPSPAEAQNNRRRTAYTDAKSADADFAYQGEFLGAYVEDDRGRQVGLQIVAQGDGRFHAVEYPGGLPGSRWNGRDRYKMQGTLREGVVEFRGPKHTFRVIPRGADVHSPDGKYLGTIWKVHRVSPTLGKEPPKSAVVLFDGTNTQHFKNGKMTSDGLLKEGTQTARAFGDFHLHLEFQLPYMPYARGQGRANSGVYLQSRYEVQILDSFGLEGKHNECAGLYRQREPDLNMCLPPLQWQTYDISFRSPKFDANGRKTANARITVRHNGVLVHDDVELNNKTGAGRPEGPKPLPTKLQNHGNPVRFRNIWLIPQGAGLSGGGTRLTSHRR